jgi:hypothetical protein
MQKHNPYLREVKTTYKKKMLCEVKCTPEIAEQCTVNSYTYSKGKPNLSSANVAEDKVIIVSE